jgi:hypothetical protein
MCENVIMLFDIGVVIPDFLVKIVGNANLKERTKADQIEGDESSQMATGVQD